jgi:glycosyltransferase involved in cell wall biosynthesis
LTSKSVLIATYNSSIFATQADAYRKLGFEVVVGAANLFHSNRRFDLIHLHWPEELVDWKAPGAEAVDRVLTALDGWSPRSKIVATVHDIPPHTGWTDEYRRLFRGIYARTSVVGHFSEPSARRFAAELDCGMADPHHVVHKPNTFGHKPFVDREAARASFGLSQSDAAVLVFGAMRSSAEIQLALRAYAKLRNRNKRLLFYGILALQSGLARRAYMARLQAQSLFGRVTVSKSPIDDSGIPKLFAAADVLLIARLKSQLNSGLLPLALEMGIPIVAPDFGMFRETLSGTPNALYAPGDPRSCAQALAAALRVSRSEVSDANQKIVSDWGWQTAVPMYVSAVAANAVASQ